MLSRLTSAVTPTRQTIIRAVIIVNVLFLAAAYAFLLRRGPSDRLFLLAILLPILVLGALVLLRYPPLGLVILVVANPIVPFAIGTGSQTSFGITIILLSGLTGLWVFDSIVRKREVNFFQHKPALPLVCFLIVSLLSFVNGLLPWYPLAKYAPLRAQLGGLALFFFSAFAFILVVEHIRRIVWLKWLVGTFLVTSSLYLLGRLVPDLNRYIGSLFVGGMEGSLFWVWVVSLSLSQAVINKDLSLLWRALLGLIALSTLFIGITNITWTSGWLPAFASALVILFLIKPAFGILPGIIGGALFIIKGSQISGTLMSGDNVYSTVTRLEAWKILGQIVQVSPLLGLGPANYYWYTPLFPIMGYAVQFNSHNNYVDIVAQTGIIGLICFLWFALSLGRLGWELRSRLQDGFQKAYAIGALGGLAGTLVAGMFGDWIIPFVYNVGYTGFRASILGWLFLGGLLALAQINPSRKLTEAIK